MIDLNPQAITKLTTSPIPRPTAAAELTILLGAAEVGLALAKAVLTVLLPLRVIT